MINVNNCFEVLNRELLNFIDKKEKEKIVNPFYYKK